MATKITGFEPFWQGSWVHGPTSGDSTETIYSPGNQKSGLLVFKLDSEPDLNQAGGMNIMWVLPDGTEYEWISGITTPFIRNLTDNVPGAGYGYYGDFYRHLLLLPIYEDINDAGSPNTPLVNWQSSIFDGGSNDITPYMGFNGIGGEGHRFRIETYGGEYSIDSNWDGYSPEFPYYAQQIIGCTDPNACNYNPGANTVGTCDYGSDCPDGVNRYCDNEFAYNSGYSSTECPCVLNPIITPEEDPTGVGNLQYSGDLTLGSNIRVRLIMDNININGTCSGLTYFWEQQTGFSACPENVCYPRHHEMLYVCNGDEFVDCTDWFNSSLISINNVGLSSFNFNLTGTPVNYGQDLGGGSNIQGYPSTDCFNQSCNVKIYYSIESDAELVDGFLEIPVPDPFPGCMDPSACNYNSQANTDDCTGTESYYQYYGMTEYVFDQTTGSTGIDYLNNSDILFGADCAVCMYKPDCPCFPEDNVGHCSCCNDCKGIPKLRSTDGTGTVYFNPTTAEGTYGIGDPDLDNYCGSVTSTSQNYPADAPYAGGWDASPNCHNSAEYDCSDTCCGYTDAPKCKSVCADETTIVNGLTYNLCEPVGQELPGCGYLPGAIDSNGYNLSPYCQIIDDCGTCGGTEYVGNDEGDLCSCDGGVRLYLDCALECGGDAFRATWYLDGDGDGLGCPEDLGGSESIRCSNNVPENHVLGTSEYFYNKFQNPDVEDSGGYAMYNLDPNGQNYATTSYSTTVLIYLHKQDQNNNYISGALGNISSGDSIRLENLQSSDYGLWTVTNTPTLDGNVFKIPVTIVEYQGNAGSGTDDRKVTLIKEIEESEKNCNCAANFFDECDVCGGDGLGATHGEQCHCDGRTWYNCRDTFGCDSINTGEAMHCNGDGADSCNQLDQCGFCGGGTDNYITLEDALDIGYDGICNDGNDPENCCVAYGTDGTPTGGLCTDANYYDCHGTCGGFASPDDCGVCNGDNSCSVPMTQGGTCSGIADGADMDCEGTCFGTANVSGCNNVCCGGTGTPDCLVEDECGICDGDCYPPYDCPTGNEVFSSAGADYHGIEIPDEIRVDGAMVDKREWACTTNSALANIPSLFDSIEDFCNEIGNYSYEEDTTGSKVWSDDEGTIMSAEYLCQKAQEAGLCDAVYVNDAYQECRSVDGASPPTCESFFADTGGYSRGICLGHVTHRHFLNEVWFNLHNDDSKELFKSVYPWGYTDSNGNYLQPYENTYTADYNLNNLNPFVTWVIDVYFEGGCNIQRILQSKCDCDGEVRDCEGNCGTPGTENFKEVGIFGVCGGVGLIDECGVPSGGNFAEYCTNSDNWVGDNNTLDLTDFNANCTHMNCNGDCFQTGVFGAPTENGGVGSECGKVPHLPFTCPDGTCAANYFQCPPYDPENDPNPPTETHYIDSCGQCLFYNLEGVLPQNGETSTELDCNVNCSEFTPVSCTDDEILPGCGNALEDDCEVCSGGNTQHAANSDKDFCGYCIRNIDDNTFTNGYDTDDIYVNVDPNGTPGCGNENINCPNIDRYGVCCLPTGVTAPDAYSWNSNNGNSDLYTPLFDCNRVCEGNAFTVSGAWPISNEAIAAGWTTLYDWTSTYNNYIPVRTYDDCCESGQVVVCCEDVQGNGICDNSDRYNFCIDFDLYDDTWVYNSGTYVTGYPCPSGFTYTSRLDLETNEFGTDIGVDEIYGCMEAGDGNYNPSANVDYCRKSDPNAENPVDIGNILTACRKGSNNECEQLGGDYGVGSTCDGSCIGNSSFGIILDNESGFGIGDSEVVIEISGNDRRTENPNYGGWINNLYSDAVSWNVGKYEIELFDCSNDSNECDNNSLVTRMDDNLIEFFYSPSGDDIRDFVQNGYLYEFDSIGDYAVKITMIAGLGEDIFSTDINSVPIYVNQKYFSVNSVVPMEQTLSSTNLPWQGINLNIAGTLFTNTQESWDSSDQDGRPQLGCFYYDDINLSDYNFTYGENIVFDGINNFTQIELPNILANAGGDLVDSYINDAFVLYRPRNWENLFSLEVGENTSTVTGADWIIGTECMNAGGCLRVTQNKKGDFQRIANYPDTWDNGTSIYVSWWQKSTVVDGVYNKSFVGIKSNEMDAWLSSGVFTHQTQGLNNSSNNGGSSATAVYQNSTSNTWEKFSFTFDIHNWDIGYELQLFIAGDNLNGEMYFDNFEVREGYNFIPDADIRKVKYGELVSLTPLYKYWDKNIDYSTIVPGADYMDTVAPLEVQLYLYPSWEIDNIFTTKNIMYDEYENGNFYVANLDWGDGTVEYSSEPVKLGNTTSLNHSYEKAGIYDITGYMLRTRIDDDGNVIGTLHNKRFVVRININEDLDNEFDYLGGDGFTFIPYKETAPVIGGISQNSIYYKSIKRQLGFLDDPNGVNEVKVDVQFKNQGDKLKTEVALAHIDASRKDGGDLNLLDGFTQQYKDDGTPIYEAVTTNFGELGQSIGDVDIEKIRYLSEPKQMYELLGFDDSDAGNPGDRRYWKNIIPDYYTILDRDGVYSRDNILPSYTCENPPCICNQDLCVDENNPQYWYLVDGVIPYYPVLPKLNQFGKFDEENLGLQGSKK